MKIKQQTDEKDCGLYVLQYFANFLHNLELDINYLKLNAQYGKDGISISCLKAIAKKNNINIESYSGDFASLRELKQQDLPLAIMVTNRGLNHYVVLEKIVGDKYYIQDSVYGGKRVLNAIDLEKIYLGVILVFSSATKQQIKQLTLTNKISDLLLFKEHNALIFIAALFNLVLTFGSTFFVKIVFDIVLPQHLVSSLIAVFAIFLLINCLRFTNNFFKNFVVHKIQTQIENNLQSALLEKFYVCSQNYLHKLSINEYMRRVSFVPMIANYRANFLYSFVFELFSILGSVLILILINVSLFGIVISVLSLTIVINFLFQSKLKKTYPVYMEEQLDKLNSEMNLIGTKGTPMSFQMWNSIFKKYEQSLLKLKTREYKFFVDDNAKNLTFDLLLGNLNLIMVFVGVLFIFKQKLSTGSLMMFMTSSSFLLTPTLSITSLWAKHSLFQKQIEELNFVLNFPAQKRNGKINFARVKSIELLNLNFYFEIQKPIINIRKLLIDKSIQLVGPNGSGKSTLLNLLSQRTEPVTGLYKINGIDIKDIDYTDFNKNFIYISHSHYLPRMTVLDYVTECSPEKVEYLNQAVNNPIIVQLINDMKLNLQDTIIDGGINFSSGQRQFIMLLKLFTQKYKLILLDEAFENLALGMYSVLKELIKQEQNQALFIEVSHSKKYVSNINEVNFEKINKIK
ncbi:Mbov_0121 family peptidase domain-containing ABC transporter [Mycoplasmopsis columbinasalis]|uniref:ABC transporter ATP-binding protein n=1 Tax=Mycoplasmopsis columbinasalis TaxID=114880 RepID=A0A449BA88_9BACT|nr:cysteine peptidase family C39 domain-containing protein [Mycoplasmopsis columbinasalis]VEU78076.1 ABC transporter ATP-binding protein [Mycoplasmopsis columbinasalis]